ncbi:type II toxin-antitoxin system RelE/ParE family toxin [Candidatus Micrarchaeota archaeon]|nr:type II toxin-antitoxin system RelE/ParE family toxin [Candidatus Micrarchaeota archaeon]
MTYEVKYSQEALSIIERVDRPVGRRIAVRISQSAADPLHFFKRLAGSELYKLRVGDWRVLALIDQTGKKVFITAMGHRKNVYD